MADEEWRLQQRAGCLAAHSLTAMLSLWRGFRFCGVVLAGIGLCGRGQECGGTVDISPRARLFVKEAEIIEALYKGLASLLDAEAKAA